AVRGDVGHLARELPADQLPAGLSHSAFVLHSTRADLPGLTRATARYHQHKNEEGIMEKRQLLQLAAGTLGLALAGGVCAQAWPVKPVRIIVPFGAGGGTDIQARLLAKSFHDSMGQTFVV